MTMHHPRPREGARPRRRAVLAGSLAAAAAGTAAACSGPGTAAMTSAEASASSPLTLRLAHNLSEDHPTGAAIADFAEQVAEHSEGRLRVQIFANGQLGSETAVLGQLRQGLLDLTRVGSPGLAAQEPGYHTFGLPYVFADEAEMHRVMDSGQMAEFYRSTEEIGFVGLTHYTSGARSMYTVDTPIRTPEDMAGMKLRVQDMLSQTQLIETLGGAPVVMAFGDTYTALQTGMIDGAESNETVLTDSAHGEVTKAFSWTRHTIIPDLLLMSADARARLSTEDQQLIEELARRSSQDHRIAWDAAIEQAVADSRDMGVEFYDDVDRAAFEEASRPLVEQFAADSPEVQRVLDIIDEVREEEDA